MFLSGLFLVLSTGLLSAAAPHVHSTETVARSLPGQWFQADDHPAHSLFRRDTSGSFAAVGTPGKIPIPCFLRFVNILMIHSEWSQGFPVPGTPLDPTKTPQAWMDALNGAIAAGKIPNISVGTPNANGPTTYGGQDGTKEPVCSAAYGCRIDGQIWDAPNNSIGISFDDGPISVCFLRYFSFIQLIFGLGYVTCRDRRTRCTRSCKRIQFLQHTSSSA